MDYRDHCMECDEPCETVVVPVTGLPGFRRRSRCCEAPTIAKRVPVEAVT